ncbi:MAG: asparaginase [Flavobacteriales bacterium]
MNKSKVLLVYTGGTIGMIQNEESGYYKPFDFDNLLEQIPELKKIDVEISAISFDKPIDSSDMNPEIWEKLADIIFENYASYDGFVILHGSDTMSYTASALSFILHGLNKPVILTGSQLPIGVIRTDGKENLITAIEIAGAKINNRPIVPEVAIYFEYQLFRGNRTAKINAQGFEAFASYNYPILAKAGVHINYNQDAIKNYDEKASLTLKKGFCRDVIVLRIFPGINETIVDYLFDAPGLKAVVLHTFGSGNAPSNPAFIKVLENAAERGILMINITQCPSGFVEQGRYQTSRSFSNIGIISGGDMTIETALCKLMFLLNKGYSTAEISELFTKNMQGEITVISSI